MNVKGVVITSSPGPISKAIMAISRVSLPLDAATQCATPTYSARRVSNSVTSEPKMYCPCSSTAWMRALIGSRKRRYWLFRSMKSMCSPRAPQRQRNALRQTN